MVGAVIHQELLLGGRRFSVHVMRWIYAGWLILQVMWIYIAFQVELFNRTGLRGLGQPVTNPTSTPEVVGARFSETFITQQVLLLLLLTPALMAGAITDEKRKGTLQHLLLTEIESRHLILGKLLGRLAQVIQVMIAGLPLFALMAGFGGVSPTSMLYAGLSLVLPLIGLASLTMLVSVSFRQTRDAVLTLYVLGVVGALFVLGVGGPLRYLDPLFCLAPAWGPSGSLDVAEANRRLLGGAIGWGVISVIALTLATIRLRPVYLAELATTSQRVPRWYTAEREPIEEEPVFWRERFVEGLAPNPTLRSIPTWLMIAVVAGISTTSSLLILGLSLTGSVGDAARALLQLNVRQVAALMPEAAYGFLIQGIVAMLVGSLIVGIRCSGAMVAERERQTWEAVLLTPLSAKKIVHGKLWGIMGASYWYLVAYAAPAVSLSVLSGPLGFAYTVLWLAATVLAMYLIGAAGLWCSVRAPNSWRALLNTVLIGYLGGLAVYAVTSPVILLLAGMLLFLLAIIDLFAGTGLANLGFNAYFPRTFAVASAIGLAVTFFILARWFLYLTQRHIADRERTRHWHDEPYYRQGRRGLEYDRSSHL
jgi:ABC-type transport system involved in multi-copper enzyme maturation permease subunit